MLLAEGEYDISILELEAVEARLLHLHLPPEVIWTILIVAAGKAPLRIHLADLHAEIDRGIPGPNIRTFEVMLIVGGIREVLQIPPSQPS